MKYYCTIGFYMSQGFQWYIFFFELQNKRYEFSKFILFSEILNSEIDQN
jgi:hypothetical protein